LYWRYESRLRALESGIGSLIGVDGPLYAVRRSCYVALPNEVISDFVTPLLVLRQGRDVVLEEEAVVAEEPTQRSGQEFATRRRITLRGLVALRIYKELLNPLKRPLLALQILFHKVVRWCVGPLLVLNFLSCVLLAGRSWFALMLAAYLVLGAAALSGWMISHAGKSNRLLAAPFYFMLVNAAATSGIIDFFLKRKAVAWKPVR
jgi:hypothetical protein